MYADFQAKPQNKKTRLSCMLFGKYSSQGHQLANKMITKNYSMYDE